MKFVVCDQCHKISLPVVDRFEVPKQIDNMKASTISALHSGLPNLRPSKQLI